jgi:hypothetical protein
MKTKLFEIKSNVRISEGLEWHIQRNLPLAENIFRYGSSEYLKLYREARGLVKRGLMEVLDEGDRWFMETDLGKVGLYEGKPVLLDFPFAGSMNEAEHDGKDVELNKPKRSSGPKKYQVYVKNDKGNVVKVNFGDVKGGLTAKIRDPEARKAFADRHNCSDKKDKTKPGYWACNMPRYSKSLGLSSGGNFYW